MDWQVDFDSRAVLDFEEVKSRGDRAAAFNAVEKLRGLGPQLGPPHIKLLTGESDLLELRPKQGRSPVRLVYARVEDRFSILAVSAKKSELNRAIQSARERLRTYP